MPVWLTVVLGAAFSAAPTFISFLPTEVQGALTAAIAMGASIYHLYQPSPVAPPKS